MSKDGESFFFFFFWWNPNFSNFPEVEFANYELLGICDLALSDL